MNTSPVQQVVQEVVDRVGNPNKLARMVSAIPGRKLSQNAVWKLVKGKTKAANYETASGIEQVAKSLGMKIKATQLMGIPDDGKTSSELEIESPDADKAEPPPA